VIRKKNGTGRLLRKRMGLLKVKNQDHLLLAQVQVRTPLEPDHHIFLEALQGRKGSDFMNINDAPFS
jgi:hypothetical protein